ncbi:MAG: peptidase S41, partial [Bacteroidota bacterium]
MRTLLLAGLLTVGAGLIAQKNLPVNLGFEEGKAEKPTGWNSFGQGGTYELTLSPQAHTGEQSISIQHQDGSDGFRAWGQDLKQPTFTGKKLQLSGWLRTENVSEGFAGLWLRIDPNVGFDNMADRGVTGTTDWQRFEVELDYDGAAAENIAFGGLLVG